MGFNNEIVSIEQNSEIENKDTVVVSECTEHDLSGFDIGHSYYYTQCICGENEIFKRKIIGGIIKIFTISLNEYLENCTDQTIKNTIAHELIHTIDGCFDHKNKFKTMAQKIKQLGYEVSRTSKSKEFSEFVRKLRQDKETRRKNKIYKVTCNHCGRSVLRQRRINVNHYICPVCHGSLRLEEV